MKYYLYANGSAENHGCEALTRSTIKILNKTKENYIENATYDLNKDKKYGIDKICKLIMVGNNLKLTKSKRFIGSLNRKILRNNNFQNQFQFGEVINNSIGKDIALSAGGDNYCYENSADILGFMNNKIGKLGLKTVLWGCSVEPAVIASKIGKAALESYDLIICRESLTFNALISNGINRNTKLFPDSAFLLDDIQLELPDGFDKNNTIGINISPLIVNYEMSEGLTIANYMKLVEYILNYTDMKIALIPHVVINGNDDRKPMKEIFEKFKHTNRIIEIADHNCMELKGFISRCRLFIGARTHATIAAYSTCVPTLVVGYSVKAKGIAKDIFGSYENYVIPVQSLTNDNNLIDAFQWLLNNESSIRHHLQHYMPSYIEKAWLAADEVNKLLGVVNEV